MYEYRAVVVSVHDGDTLTLDVALGFQFTVRLPIRLYGLNAPELSTPEGKAAAAFVQTLLPAGQAVVLRSHKDAREKFGRWLGEILIGETAGQVVNELLIAKGLAKRWDGKGAKPV